MIWESLIEEQATQAPQQLYLWLYLIDKRSKSENTIASIV